MLCRCLAKVTPLLDFQQQTSPPERPPVLERLSRVVDVKTRYRRATLV